MITDKVNLITVFAEAGECGDELWEKDVSSRREYFQDQMKNSTCNDSVHMLSSGNRWSTITFHMGETFKATPTLRWPHPLSIKDYVF